ncbi:MAG: TetR/AcrR family transcriptional regulator [Actinomycetota bacterium]|nr:TetR/AcrR family transcriptional regulator [Actinomycetota bacterium]
MPPRQRVRRAPREQTRREILDAAARTFARRGFHGASVEAVAAEAGLSTGAVYSNFKGKEDLFLTLYEERLQTRARDLREAARAAGTAEAALSSATSEVTRVLQADREWLLLYFEFALLAARDPKFARRFRNLRRRGLDELTKGIDEGLRAAGRDPSPAPRVARAARAAAYGTALEYLLGEAKRDDGALEDALRMVFRGAAE